MEDFRSLIELLLPTSLRSKRLLALLDVLIGTPLEHRHSEYNIWRESSRFDASITPQVCSLRHAIEHKYDVHCNFVGLDGKPYDFLVEIDRSADFNSIYEFLLKYGPAGKSFVFNLGDTTYEASWIDFVEENQVTTFTAEWTGYTEQDDGEAPIDIYFYYIPNPAERKLQYCIEVKSQVRIEGVFIGIVTYKSRELWFFTDWKEHIVTPDGSRYEILYEDVTGEEFERSIYAVVKDVEGATPKRRYYIDHIYYVRPDELNKQ